MGTAIQGFLIGIGIFVFIALPYIFGWGGARIN